VGRREEELALEGTLVERSVWEALEAGRTGRMLGIVVTCGVQFAKCEPQLKPFLISYLHSLGMKLEGLQ
jgi:hypothetical protein